MTVTEAAKAVLEVSYPLEIGNAIYGDDFGRIRTALVNLRSAINEATYTEDRQDDDGR